MIERILKIVSDRSFARFLVSGFCAAIAEYVIFLSLYSLLGHWSLLLCQVISFLCGAAISFSLNRLWVFKSNGNIKHEFAKYMTLVVINLFISGQIIWLLVNEIRLSAWIAKLITMAIIALWNFLIFQKLVFKRTS